VTSTGKVVPPLGFGAFLDDDDEGEGHRAPTRSRAQQGAPGSGPGSVNVGPGGYTKEEIDVLRWGVSFII